MNTITNVDFSLETNAILNLLLPDLWIIHTWLSELCITLNNVVATNNKNKIPAMAMGQLLASPLNPRKMFTTWCTLSWPKKSASSANNCVLTARLLKIKLSNCISNNKMGGSAKVVKKAVAPANLSGSFFTSNLNALTNALPRFLICLLRFIKLLLLLYGFTFLVCCL